MGQPVPAEDLPSGAVPASDMPVGQPGSSAAPTPAATPKAPGILSQAMETAQYALPVIGPTRALGKATDVLDKYAYKAGQAVTDIAAPHMPPEAAAMLGTGANLAVQAPAMAAGGEGAKVLSAPMQSGARKLMSMALKPSRAAWKNNSADIAITKLLDKGWNVTKGGVEKMTAEIDRLDDALTAALQNAKGNVSTVSVMQPIRDALKSAREGLDHAENSEAIRKELLKFFDHPEVQGAFQIPVQTAQKIKRAIYREVGDAGYGAGLKPMAGREGKKAVARGLNEGLGRVSPEAAKANEEMSPILKARKLAQERVHSAANTNLMGLGWMIHNPKLALAWLMERHPGSASWLANRMHAASKGVPERLGEAGVAATAEGGRPKEKSR